MDKLLAAQKEISKLSFVKDATAQYGKYLSLSEIMKKVLPILNKHDLVLTQSVTTQDGQPALTTKIGELESTMYLLLQSQSPQGQGSAITYARRYSICSMLGIVADDDDDGNAAQSDDVKLAIPARESAPTAAQLGFIDKLLTNKGIDNDKKREVVKMIIGKDSTEMNRLEATELIEELKNTKHETLQNMASGDPF